MIRYSLICDTGHAFESWFANSSGFEEQAQRGLVTCPVCDSPRVERAVMAPAVARTDHERRGRGAAVPPAAEPAAAPVPAEPTQPVALIGEREKALRAMIGALHAHVAQSAEHVGKRFADEALKIHHGESESRAIYGEASLEDARMLHEEGVAFLPLPRLPDGGN
ncbi:DUF1178 family protein [Bosea sp. TWI1241]|uniref:DUF1178 family protein n=1 Tax=Bosea sp. TWI1241 TaxID=3148904 RepID=UPI00320A9D1E